MPAAHTAPPTRLDVTIFAFNEADRIGALLGQLSEQTVVSSPDFDVNVVVIANGCTDSTVEVARRTLEANAADGAAIEWSIHDLDQKGKANAWSRYVHSIASDDVDIVTFLDADIELLHDDAVERCVRALLEERHALVSVGRGVKDAALSDHPSIIDRISTAASNTEFDPDTAISGQFYCVRMDALRRIQMPTSIIGEDGYLRAMLLTDGFQSTEDLGRVVSVAEVGYSFETLRSPQSIVHHQIRLTIGTITNLVLFRELERHVASGGSTADFVRERNASRPEWLSEQVAGIWLAADNRPGRRRFRHRRLRLLAERPWSDRVRRAPIYIAATAVDYATYVVAVRRIRRGTAAGYW